jgi:hypothetical protein
LNVSAIDSGGTVGAAPPMNSGTKVRSMYRHLPSSHLTQRSIRSVMMIGGADGSTGAPSAACSSITQYVVAWLSSANSARKLVMTWREVRAPRSWRQE